MASASTSPNSSNTRTTRPPARSRTAVHRRALDFERGGDSEIDPPAAGHGRHRCRDSRRTPAARALRRRAARAGVEQHVAAARSRHGCGTRSGSGSVAVIASISVCRRIGAYTQPRRGLAALADAGRRRLRPVHRRVQQRRLRRPRPPRVRHQADRRAHARPAGFRRRIASPPAGADRRTCRSRSRPGSPASPAPGTGSARTRRGSRPDTARTGLRRVRAAGSGTRQLPHGR